MRNKNRVENTPSSSDVENNRKTKTCSKLLFSQQKQKKIISNDLKLEIFPFP